MFSHSGDQVNNLTLKFQKASSTTNTMRTLNSQKYTYSNTKKWHFSYAFCKLLFNLHILQIYNVFSKKQENIQYFQSIEKTTEAKETSWDEKFVKGRYLIFETLCKQSLWLAEEEKSGTERALNGWNGRGNTREIQHLLLTKICWDRKK